MTQGMGAGKGVGQAPLVGKVALDFIGIGIGENRTEGNDFTDIQVAL